MIKLELKISDPQMRVINAALEEVPRGVTRAVGAAVRRTTTTVRTRIVRAVAKDLGIAGNKLYKKGATTTPIRQRFIRADNQVSASTIVITGKRIPLREFHPTQRRAGVSYRIGQRGRTVAPHTFIARMRSGYEGVFKRVGRSRLPIFQPMGPSVPHVAENRPEIVALIDHEAAELLQKNLDEQTTRILAQQQIKEGDDA